MSIRTHRDLLLGIATLVVVGLLGLGTFALYNDAFADTEQVTVQTSRAGLTMTAGAVVKVRGVEVGKVAQVRSTAAGAELVLAIDSAMMDRIPGAPRASIVPPTAFGQKYVELTGDPDSGPLTPGTVIGTERVTTEINQAFTSLARVLEVARPSEVAGALTALATAVDTRGDELGQVIAETDEWLAGFNPALPALAQDLRRIDDVLRAYDDASDDLVAMLADGTVTLTTVHERQDDLRGLLTGVDDFSTGVDTVATRHAPALSAALAEVAPTTALLAKYAPMLPCTVTGIARLNHAAEKAIGGTNPGITTLTRLQPGDPAYRAPEDLPVVADRSGPDCFGLPQVTAADAEAQMPAFDVGTNPYHRSEGSTVEDLTRTLLGIVVGSVVTP